MSFVKEGVGFAGMQCALGAAIMSKEADSKLEMVGRKPRQCRE